MIISYQSRQTGAVALLMAALVVLAAAIPVSIYKSLPARSEMDDAGADVSALRQAERLIEGYASIHGRIPCPSSSMGGPEDCSGKMVGWLPLKLLTDTTSRESGLYSVAYAIDLQIGDKLNVTESTETYSPLAKTSEDSPKYHPATNQLDLCEKLGRYTAMSIPALDVKPDINTFTNEKVIIRLSINKIRDTNGVLSQGNIASTQNDSAFPQASNPPANVLVNQITAAGLYRELSCEHGFASMHGLKTAGDISSEADGLRNGIITAGQQMIAIAGPVVAGDALSVAANSTDVINAIYDIGFAAEWIPFWTQFLSVPGVQLVAAEKIAELNVSAATAKAGLVQVSINIARGTIGTVVDAVYMDAYKKAQASVEKIVNWSGATDILQAADDFGFSN